MAIQYSVAINNARLDAVESTVGGTAILRIYSGAAPANVAAAVTGTLLCEMTLPADWMSNASAAQKAKLGTWTGTGAAGAGAGTNAGYFRIFNSTGATPGVQGTCGATGSGQDMILDNVSIANGQTVTVNTFQLNAANT
jgi:hypothetical protein